MPGQNLRSSKFNTRIKILRRETTTLADGQVTAQRLVPLCQMLAHVEQVPRRETADELWIHGARWRIETWMMRDVEINDVVEIPEFGKRVEIDTILYEQPFMILEGASDDNVRGD